MLCSHSLFTVSKLWLKFDVFYKGLDRFKPKTLKVPFILDNSPSLSALVFCGAARNRVVCRQRERPNKSGHLHPKTLKETQDAIKTLIASTKPATEEV